VPGGVPLFLNVAPQPDCQPLRCFNNVRRAVELYGGYSTHGWLIWQSQIAFDAVFHAVWEVRITTIAKGDPAEWPTAEKPLPAGWTLSKEHRHADTVIGIDKDGSIRVPGGGMSAKRVFEGSFDLHVEFMNPLQPKDHSQGRGNSGCYLPNGSEIQVLDSFGECTYRGGGCGGLYAYKDPDTMEVIDSIKGAENKYTLASLPPLAWQTYDVEYRVEKKDGKLTGKPKVTVYHNGIKIHDSATLNQDAKPGNFHWQDHGNAVRYRNIWVLPVEPKG
jgi:hypothetical protein